MDAGTFDRLTRTLAARLTRRSGIAAALGALAATTATPAADGAARSRDLVHGRADAAAGVVDEKNPCGSKPKPTTCRKHNDCCTRYCEPPKKKGKPGRCACIKTGKACKSGQICCGGGSCRNRKCSTQPACGAAGAACAGNASCCAGFVCTSLGCAACSANVCASGCAFTSVNAAYAAAAPGATIVIAPGEYPVGFTVTRDVTLTSCQGAPGVTLRPDGLLRDGSGAHVVMIAEHPTTSSPRRTVTLRNLALKGSGAASKEILLFSGINESVDFAVENCAVDGAWELLAAGAGRHLLHGVTIANTFKGAYLNTTRSPGVITLDVRGSSFTNAVTVDGVYSYFIDIHGRNGAVTIADSSVNNSDGGIYVDLSNQSTLTATDVSITGIRRAESSITYRGTFDATRRSDTRATLTRVKVSGGMTSPGFYGGSVQVDDSAFTNIGPSSQAPVYVNCANLTLTDTIVSGNQNPGRAGGGIQLVADLDENCNNSVTLTLAGTTQVTGNAAATGSGLAIRAADIGYSVIGGGKITGNTGSPQCAKCIKSGGTCSNSDYVAFDCAAP